SHVLRIPCNPTQVRRRERPPKPVPKQKHSRRTRALTVLDQRSAIRIELDNFLQVFARIIKTSGEHDQVRLDPLTILKLDFPALVATDRRRALDQSLPNSANHCASCHRLSKPAHAPPKQPRGNMLGKPR